MSHTDHQETRRAIQRRVASQPRVTRRLLTAAALTAIAAAVAPATVAARPAVAFRLAVHFGADPFVDTGSPGPSVGDLRILGDALYRGSRHVGRDGGSCVITNATRPEASCTVTWRLPRGTITGQWLNQPPPRKLVAVTGGTGIYRNARGQAVVVERSTDRGFVTFHLLGGPARL